jgi:hypothetical protein
MNIEESKPELESYLLASKQWYQDRKEYLEYYIERAEKIVEKIKKKM